MRLIVTNWLLCQMQPAVAAIVAAVVTSWINMQMTGPSVLIGVCQTQSGDCAAPMQLICHLSFPPLIGRKRKRLN